jgi:hypothetical protein
MSVTLVVEDGTIVSGANSYVSLNDAATYWANLGTTFPQGTTDAQKETAIFNAAQSMERLYGRFHAGHVFPYSPQSLLWPRQGLQTYCVRAAINDPAGTGMGARLAVRVVNGSVTDVYVINGGVNYSGGTTINFQGKGQGATATLTIASGKITAVTVTNGGIEYFSPRSILTTEGRFIFNDEIPQNLKDAQCEIALFALANNNLYPEENDERIVKSETQRIGGVLDQSVEYWNQQKVDLERYPGYRKIELILNPILYKRVINV